MRLPPTLARHGSAYPLSAQGDRRSGDIMSVMDISSHLDFAAAPAEVYAMMTDQKYLEEVCVASESLSYNVSVDGSTTRTSRTLPAPDSAARFTGPQLTVNDEVVWADPASDGSRSGAVTMKCSVSQSISGASWMSRPEVGEASSISAAN